VKDGTPDFLGEDFYFGEIERGEMQRLNAHARTAGWRRALSEALGESRSHLVQYAADDSRADWRFFAPLSPDAAVLDLGSGWGTLAIPLARECGEVVAVEGTWERLEFMRIRAAQEAIGNITPVRANVLALPFRPHAFDLAVMNGILEWVGMWDPERSPVAAQEQFLRRVRELLKPGGCLYIGIESRFGIANWLGRTDHSGLPFTSLMPRWLADLVVRLRSRTWRSTRNPQRYRTYTYTWRGYQKLLRRCGFDYIKIYVPIPGYNRPQYLFSLNAPHVARFCVRDALAPISRKRRLAARLLALALALGVYEYLCSDFCIFAQVAP
jgi:ubiquinone/menaquinone biosynthesis C-methylase UbiE